jgi:hypothetical protein
LLKANTVLGDAIYSNDEQGIDINNDNAVLTNDGIFDGTNSNQGIDFPEITESTSCDGSSSITTYDLRVPIGEDYRVEFFTVTSPDATNGEGETFVGAATESVTSNPQSFIYDHGFDIGTGAYITATATQISSGNTSEFGDNVLTIAASGDPSISYDDICPWDVASPNFDGDTGGEFRFSDPAPADAATIDPVTGLVSGGIEGTTYEVIYGFSGSCDVEDTTTFTVTEIDEGFTFADFCPDGTGIPGTINTPGGAFSLNPDFGDGASITTDAGILTGGIEGTAYTVQYIASDGTCSDTSTVDVFVISVDESFTMADFCPELESPAAVPVTPGGDFYFAHDPGDSATIDIATGAVTFGIEGATYMIRYVAGSCAEEDTISVNVIATDESFVFDDFCPDEIGSPTAVVIPYGFSFLTDPADGATIDAVTGNITFGVEGTTYEILHTVGTCSDKDTAYPTVITVNEEFTFADFCIEGDSSSTAPIAVDPANSNYILLEPIDGATINPETGVIYDPIEGVTYKVIDSVSTLGCWQADTVLVTPLNIDESFIMAEFCAELESPAAVPVTPGGDFYFAPDPGDGDTIDIATGAVTGGIEGTIYMIRYLVGAYAEEDTISVNVIATDESFVFNDFCPDEIGSPTFVVIPSGFSFLTDPADGATINPETGVIYDPTEGTTYTVIDSVSTLGCWQADTVLVTPLNIDESFTMADFSAELECPAAVPVTSGGDFFFAPDPGDGATIDIATGAVTGGIEGATYIIRYVVGTCAEVDTISVNVITIDESFVFNDFCPETVGSPTLLLRLADSPF